MRRVLLGRSVQWLCCLVLWMSSEHLNADVEKLPPNPAPEIELEGLVEAGYQDEDGRYVVDLLERSSTYLGVLVSATDGQPVVGSTAELSLQGTSQLVPGERISDDNGLIEFQVIAGQMGLDQITVQVGDQRIEFVVNVISLSSTGFPEPKLIEGGIPWSDLLEVQLEYKDRVLYADFSKRVRERAGEVVKLSGFMMPLDPDIKQKRFILTSNPPSCFFHIPGGPAGSVEVFAPDGIDIAWNPIVIEGRFEPQETSDIGVVYRLLDARLVTP